MIEEPKVTKKYYWADWCEEYDEEEDEIENESKNVKMDDEKASDGYREDAIQKFEIINGTTTECEINFDEEKSD